MTMMMAGNRQQTTGQKRRKQKKHVAQADLQIATGCWKSWTVIWQRKTLMHGDIPAQNVDLDQQISVMLKHMGIVWAYSSLY